MGLKPRKRPAFRLDSHAQLVALHRALMEAKFNDGPVNRDVSASPELAAMANAVVAELAAAEPDGQWAQWRVATPWRREWRVCLDRVRDADRWTAMTDAQRRAYTRDLFAPLVLSPGDVDRFLHDADAVVAARTAARNRVRHAVRDVIELIVAGELERVERLTEGRRLSASQLRAAVNGFQLDAPGDDDIHLVEAAGLPRRWLAECDLGEPTLVLALTEDVETGSLSVVLERFERL